MTCGSRAAATALDRQSVACHRGHQHLLATNSKGERCEGQTCRTRYGQRGLRRVKGGCEGGSSRLIDPDEIMPQRQNPSHQIGLAGGGRILRNNGISHLRSASCMNSAILTSRVKCNRAAANDQVGRSIGKYSATTGLCEVARDRTV